MNQILNDMSLEEIPKALDDQEQELKDNSSREWCAEIWLNKFDGNKF